MPSVIAGRPLLTGLSSPPARRGRPSSTSSRDSRGGTAGIRATGSEARRRQAQVVFVQAALPDSLDPQLDEEGRVTFRMALEALRVTPHVPASFEVRAGAVEQVLCSMCDDAALLVVGEDRRGSHVAAACRRDAGCDVLVVEATD